MKKKQPGRVKLRCSNPDCGKEFSTHSSNRTKCHQCQPKCQARHYFNRKLAKPAEPVDAAPAA